MGSRIVWACRALEQFSAWFGRAAGWLLPILVVAVCLSILAAALRVNVVLDWPTRLPLLEGELTVNGLLDLHWHLFAILVMLGGAYALESNAHVSVDFISSSFPSRLRLVIAVAGDVLLLLPFCCLMAWFSWKFMISSWNAGEGSSYGGLSDRWLIKAVLPFGFILLIINATARTIRHTIEILQPSIAEDASPTEIHRG